MRSLISSPLIRSYNPEVLAFDYSQVDEYHLFVAPVIIGGGKPVLPGNVRVTLELLDKRGFDKGMVYLRYRAIRT